MSNDSKDDFAAQAEERIRKIEAPDYVFPKTFKKVNRIF